MMNRTIGCTTRPFREFGFAEACLRIAGAGYTDVAVFSDAGLDAESPREKAVSIRKTAISSGLVPSMLLAHPHPERPDAARDYRRLIDNAAALGVAWLLDLGTPDDSLLDAYVSLMREAAPHADEAGIGISLKPHGGITLTTDGLIGVCERVDHPAFGVSYDPGNIIYYSKGAEMPQDSLERVAPLVTTAIVKDCILRNGNPDVMVTPGEGLVDFPAVLAGLTQGGFSGPFYVECVGGTTIEEISDNLRTTRELVANILQDLST